jgi:hypothetical protein
MKTSRCAHTSLGPAVLLLDATPVDMRAVMAFQDAST